MLKVSIEQVYKISILERLETRPRLKAFRVSIRQTSRTYIERARYTMQGASWKIFLPRAHIQHRRNKKVAGAKVEGEPPPPSSSKWRNIRVCWKFSQYRPCSRIRYTVCERSWIEFLGIQREKLTFSDTPTVSRYGKRASSQRKSPIAGRGRKEIHSPWSVQPVSRTSFINFLV